MYQSIFIYATNTGEFNHEVLPSVTKALAECVANKNDVSRVMACMLVQHPSSSPKLPTK